MEACLKVVVYLTSSRERRASGENLVYAVSPEGHRQSYLDTLGRMFELEPISGRMNAALFLRLVMAERLLFATLDDHIPSFTTIAIARSLRTSPTVALFLRAQKCFESGKWYYSMKRRLFRSLRHLPRLTIATITPFEATPHYAEVAHSGVCDPQYWDLHENDGLRQPPSTPLSENVRARADGRHVLCTLGSFRTWKGLVFLAETLERFPSIAEHTLVVSAGRVPPEAAPLGSRMMAAGALIIDRFITDAEIESLYGVSDCIWACYAPDYDQASGIFGRAIQLGIPPIVRDGSVIAAFAAASGVGHLKIAYGAHQALAELLMRLPSPDEIEPRLSERDRTALIGTWRRQFVETIGRGLADDEILTGAGNFGEHRL